MKAYIWSRENTKEKLCLSIGYILLILPGVTGSCLQMFEEISQDKVTIMCENSFVQGTEVFIDTDLAASMTLSAGTVCTCDVITQSVTQTDISSNFNGIPSTRCSTSTEFQHQALNYTMGNPCYSFSYDFNTTVYKNITVNVRKTDEPAISTYCVKISINTEAESIVTPLPPLLTVQCTQSPFMPPTTTTTTTTSTTTTPTTTTPSTTTTAYPTTTTARSTPTTTTTTTPAPTTTTTTTTPAPATTTTTTTPVPTTTTTTTTPAPTTTTLITTPAPTTTTTTTTPAPTTTTTSTISTATSTTTTPQTTKTTPSTTTTTSTTTPTAPTLTATITTKPQTTTTSSTVSTTTTKTSQTPSSTTRESVASTTTTKSEPTTTTTTTSTSVTTKQLTTATNATTATSTSTIISTATKMPTTTTVQTTVTQQTQTPAPTTPRPTTTTAAPTTSSTQKVTTETPRTTQRTATTPVYNQMTTKSATSREDNKEIMIAGIITGVLVICLITFAIVYLIKTSDWYKRNYSEEFSDFSKQPGVDAYRPANDYVTHSWYPADEPARTVSNLPQDVTVITENDFIVHQ